MEFGGGCLYREHEGGLSVGVSFKETSPKQESNPRENVGEREAAQKQPACKSASPRWRLPGTGETGEETAWLEGRAGERGSWALAGPGCGVGLGGADYVR